MASIDSTGDSPDAKPKSSPIAEVFRLFLKLGLIGFGGPAAHIAMMRDEVVQRRRWLNDQEFLDMVGATNVIPGPNSTEMAIHLGHRRAGWRGLIVGGACFIIPAMLIVLAIAILYVEYGETVKADWLLYGIKPVIIAVILQALLALGRRAIKGPVLAVIVAAVIALYLIGINELLLLFAGAALYLLIKQGFKVWKERTNGIALLPLIASVPPAFGAATVPGFSMTTLFLTFLKIGAVLYGSGYVLLAFLHGDFVDRLGWLTEQQLLDAIAVGQFTPGPVFTTATFVGYLVGGWPAALVATVAIFLPAFVFVFFLSRILPIVRRSPTAGLLLDGINATSLAIMAGVTWQLGRASVIDWFTILLGLASLLAVFRLKVNSAWIVLGGGLAGLAYKGVTQGFN
ncbi:MAG: chromate efflux transporter [SAR202 cluster bacterium]|nr:chromate efflux transporter [SAR202 cluster bacterium]